MAATRKTVIGGNEISRKFIGSHEVKAQYCGGVLFWEKESGPSGLGVWKFRYMDFVRFICWSYICDVDFGDGTKAENIQEATHTASGSHVCTVTIKEAVSTGVSLGAFLEFDSYWDDSGERYCQITETITDIPGCVDQAGENLMGTGYAFHNCSYLSRVHDTLFKNLVSSTQHISTFEGAASLQSVGEKVYSYFKADPKVTPVSFESHFYGCQELTEAPKLFEMFPNAVGRHCYNGCKKLPYYNEISFPWRTDLEAEDVLTMVFPPESNYDCPVVDGNMTFTVMVRPEMFKYATEAILTFEIGSSAGQSKVYNIKELESGTVSATLDAPRGTTAKLTVRVYANERIYEEGEWEELNVGYYQWKINMV